MKKLWKKYKLDCCIALYFIFYLFSFIWLEFNTKTYYVIETPLDQIIPFCEWFIIPYLGWFVFVFMTKIYFSKEGRPKEEYHRLLSVLFTGMTVFLIISFIFPNGHNLRPEVTGNGILSQLIKIVHYFDTPSNVLPSLHVFEAVACCTALLSNKEFKEKRNKCVFVVILTFSIVFSTMFLKQHSVIDVLAGLLLYVFCHELFYRILPRIKSTWGEYINRYQILSIPNLLSMFRIGLAILFLGIFNRYGMKKMRIVLLIILAISGITDFLDGKIARKYNMITEFGKLIDPIADKLTQAVILWCCIERYPNAKVLFLLLVIKESYMFVEGTKTVIAEGKNEGAKWYGKVSTAIFYIVMMILIMFKNISQRTANLFLSFSCICMLMSFLMYALEYRKKQAVLGKEKKGEWI